MTLPPDDTSQTRDQQLQREIRSGRRFSLAEAIGREGSSFLKGESLVPRVTQATNAILVFIDQHLEDSTGALQATLNRWVQGERFRVSQHIQRPLGLLHILLTEILEQPETLYELVRQADVRWGEIYGERPYFQKPGDPPHPEDEYTHESVRQQLELLLAQVLQALGPSELS